MKQENETAAAEKPLRGKKNDEIRPGLWKLLVAAGGILVVIFVAMELADDTYLNASDTLVSLVHEKGGG